MTPELTEKFEQFIFVRQSLATSMKWETQTLFPVCAAYVTNMNKDLDIGKVKKCKELINSNTALFSQFKGISRLPLAVNLSFFDEPEAEFAKIKKAYECLKVRFTSSSYLPLTAQILVSGVEEDRFEAVVEKASEIYKRMKKEHPFLTSYEDCTTAVLFASHGVSDVDRIIEKMEIAYELLSDEPLQHNARQTISHILTMNTDSVNTNVSRYIKLRKKLEERGLRVGSGVELATLAVLAIQITDTESTAKELCELENMLKEQRGFGSFYMSTSQRLMYACVLDSQVQNGDYEFMNSTAITSVTAAILAQQAAMSAAIAASAATSAAK